MATTKKKVPVGASRTWTVYMLVNHDVREIYFGVAYDPQRRLSKAHCVGKTKALAHWRCRTHDIRLYRRGSFLDQRDASARAHDLERTYIDGRGYFVIRTGGI